ncbi:MAG: hypothetical protein RL339_2016 [Pseudomonadota bacterium]|jgi:hypothetical protein
MATVTRRAGLRSSMPRTQLVADVSSKQRYEPVSLEPHRLVANVDAALEQQVLDIPDA